MTSEVTNKNTNLEILFSNKYTIKNLITLNALISQNDKNVYYISKKKIIFIGSLHFIIFSRCKISKI